MNSDTNSDVTFFQTISQFINSEIETPDEFADSEPSSSTYIPASSSTFSKPTFQPIQHQTHCISLSTPSHVSQGTPTYSPFISERSTINSPNNIKISEELENFITLQQQLQYPHALAIHQLSSTITSSHPPTPTSISDYTPSFSPIIHINRIIH